MESTSRWKRFLWGAKVRPIRVLLLDEEEKDRHLLKEQLENLYPFYIFSEAADGNTALDLCRSHKPDCIVMELRFSRDIGIETLARLKDEFRHTTPPHVIIWTEYKWAKMEDHCRELGISGYFPKGTTNAGTLDLAIRQAVGGKTE